MIDAQGSQASTLIVAPTNLSNSPTYWLYTPIAVNSFLWIGYIDTRSSNLYPPFSLGSELLMIILE